MNKINKVKEAIRTAEKYIIKLAEDSKKAETLTDKRIFLARIASQEEALLSLKTLLKYLET